MDNEISIKTNICPEINSFNKNLIYEGVKDERVDLLDASSIERKIKEFKSNNKEVVIVTDFDYTLTRRQNISPIATRAYFSTYCVLEYSLHVPVEFKDEKDRLYQEYHDYEDDLSVDLEIRKKMISEW